MTLLSWMIPNHRKLVTRSSLGYCEMHGTSRGKETGPRLVKWNQTPSGFNWRNAHLDFSDSKIDICADLGVFAAGDSGTEGGLGSFAGILFGTPGAMYKSIRIVLWQRLHYDVVSIGQAEATVPSTGQCWRTMSGLKSCLRCVVFNRSGEMILQYRKGSNSVNYFQSEFGMIGVLLGAEVEDESRWPSLLAQCVVILNPCNAPMELDQALAKAHPESFGRKTAMSHISLWRFVIFLCNMFSLLVLVKCEVNSSFHWA